MERICRLWHDPIMMVLIPLLTSESLQELSSTGQSCSTAEIQEEKVPVGVEYDDNWGIANNDAALGRFVVGH